MKLLLIGNSHAAMLIAAHGLAPDGAQLTVFAKPGLCDDDLELDGSHIAAASEAFRQRLETAGTAPSLQLDAFDAVLIAGLAPSAFAAVRLTQQHHVTGWPSGERAMSRVLSDKAPARQRPMITRAAYRETLLSLTRDSLAARIARATAKPVAFVPQPFPSEALLETNGQYPIFRRVIEQGDGTALHDDLVRAHGEVFSAIPNAVYLPQPEQTLSNGCLTLQDYMRGAPRLAEGGQQANTDILHGNSSLGSLFLNAFRATRIQQQCIETASNP